MTQIPMMELHQQAADAFQSGNKGAAVDILEKALQTEPSNPWFIGEMGGVLIELGRRGTASALLSLACLMEKQRGVEDWRHWQALGSTLEHLEQRELADQAFQEAARVAPEVSAIYDQWAGVYVNSGNPKRCIELARKALELDPNNVIAKKHLALGLLEAGEWAEAWPMMEFRKQVADYQRPIYPLPQWKGEAVDTLIVHGEQGIGDELMYLSLVHRIRDRARRVVLEVTPRLVPLIRRSFSQLGCEVYASLDEAAANGVLKPDETRGTHGSKMVGAPAVTPAAAIVDLSHITIGGDTGYDPNLGKPSIVSQASLPYVLGLGRTQVRSAGYLLPDPTRVNYWSEKLRADAKGRPIIGIAWEGGVRKTHKKVRNAPFEMWAPIVADQRFYWVSVQYTHGEIENKVMPGTAHYQQAIDDLDEQAALISALDLLVSVPQTAVHMAGALAVPTIAVVSKAPRWDFCSTDDQMPWWESVTMIKQQGEWNDVFARLKAALDRRFPMTRQMIHDLEAAE